MFESSDKNKNYFYFIMHFIVKCRCMSHFLKSTTTKGPFRQYIYAVEKEKYLYNTPVTSVNLAFFRHKHANISRSLQQS